MKKIFLIYLGSFWLFSIFLFPSLWEGTGVGFSQTLNLNQFGIEEGLPQSSIYTMVPDKEGSIWVGTMNGVSRYNGLNFENFAKKDGLAENRTTSSCMDKDGNIWFGHWSGGISKYDFAAKKFSAVNTGNIKLNKTINCILQDKNGTMWFGTDGQGVIKMEDGNFTQLTIKDGLASNWIKCFMQHKDGKIWIGTADGINYYYSGKIDNDISHAGEVITSFLFDRKSNLWIGTSNKGTYRIFFPPNSKADVTVNYNTSNGLANDNVRVIFEDASGNIFIGTYGGGVSKYLPQLEANDYKGSLFQTISSKQGLSNDRVLSIIQDREKNIWIGTYLNLNQYFDEQFEIYGENEGLTSSLIWSVIQDKKGNFWIGTEGGLYESPSPALFEGKGTSAEKQFIRITGKEGEILNTGALCEDAKGNIWFTDFGKGVSRYNPATKKTDLFTTEKGDLPVNEIYCISADKDGNIWLGTNKGGLMKFDIATEKFEQFTAEKDGIGSNQIYTIFRDSKDRLWLGTLSGNLTLYDGSAFKMFSGKEGFPSKFTLCITEDKNGNIWLGTYEMGIYKYDGSSFKNYSANEGLSSNTPFLLLADEKNNLWIGTGLGVDKFNPEENAFKHYEREDGFLGVEINPNAACRDKDGNLWFGSITGLVKYNSARSKTNELEPITQIKNPKIFFNEAEIPSDHIFSWNQNHLTFDFIGTSLTNPKRVKYKYMLEGVDSTWSPVTKATSVTFPDLQPGNYVFKVKSCNNDGVWNKEPVTFSFTILPPFWKTTWFYSLCAAGILLIIIVYIKLRERKLRKENIILEQKVRERTQVINEQKILLEKRNRQITDSIDYAKRIQEAIFTSAGELKKYPFESFLFFKPKDIVSGDFYWARKKNDDEFFITVADCTGHGVPGAFMSLIGHNLLNYVIKDLGIVKPSQILDQLSHLLRETLSGSSEGFVQMKDGMTIAFCSVNTKKMQVEFSGSYNPLYHLHNGELTEYKGNRIPIGHTESKIEKGNFTTHFIDIKKGDILYLFSDGYADQAGGPHKKKFYYSPFKKLLTEIHILPMQEQKKKLDEIITGWMNGREQVDDITVMGIRF